MAVTLFKDRPLVIATKHGKEEVIAPILEKELGVHCFVTTDLDTDLLGTFTGEIERTLNPIDAAREKCLRAMRLTNCDLAVASEGSFGPHPSAYFVNANEELLLFLDTKNNIEIVARHISTETNFNGKEINSERDLLAFSKAALFPSHGLILKDAVENPVAIIKDIPDDNTLLEAFHKLKTNHKQVFVETDMRAMNNPSRMIVIEETTKTLIKQLLSYCPACGFPGFNVTHALTGLPCDLCGLPTNTTRSLVYSCQHCDYTKEELFPNGKSTEDPMYCDYCNP